MKRSRHRLIRSMVLLCALAAGVLSSLPLGAADRVLASFPGPAGKNLACHIGTDGLLTVFYAGSGTAAGPGRVAWITGLSRAGKTGAAGGLLPPGRVGEVTAYGPTTVLLPGDSRPSAAWVERQDGGCRLFLSRPTAEAGRWSVPEAVIPRPVDLIRFLHGAGPWLVWVESHTYDDDIVACRRGPGGWEQPVAVSLGDDSEDLSPRVALHPSGAPWVVWAGGRDGGRDEIFLSRLKGKQWVREQSVSREDDTPDVLPDLAISPDGLACAVWLGYDRKTRDYRVTAAFSSDGENWSEEISLGQGSFSRPPRLTLLDDGRFLLLWADAAGALWQAEQNGARWSAPREIQTLDGDAGAMNKAALLLLHRSKQGDGSLVAVPRKLP